MLLLKHNECSADLGVNSKIVQIRPTVKTGGTKISKKMFCIFVLDVTKNILYQSLKVIAKNFTGNDFFYSKSPSDLKQPHKIVPTLMAGAETPCITDI